MSSKLAPMSIETGDRPARSRHRRGAGESRSGYTAADGTGSRGRWFCCEVMQSFWDSRPKALGCAVAMLIGAVCALVVVGLAVPMHWVGRWLPSAKGLSGMQAPYEGKKGPLKYGTYTAIGSLRRSESWRTVVGPVRKETEFAGFGETWETRIDNGYPTAYYDAKNEKWRLWYGDCEAKDKENRCKAQLLLYAESKDGFLDAWTKPEVEMRSSLPRAFNETVNAFGPNVVAKGGGVGVFRDPVSGDWVALGKVCADAHTGTATEHSAYCPRGFRKRNLIRAKEWRDWSEDKNGRSIDWSASAETQRWDCHNNLAYDHHRKVYLATTRTYSKLKGRQVAVATAKHLADFYGETEAGASKSTVASILQKSTLPVTTLAGSLSRQMYSQVTSPWRDVYLGFVSVYYPREYGGDDTVHCRLAFSTDAQRGWSFVGASPVSGGNVTDLIPLGSEGAFDASICFAAAPVLAGDVHRIYYFGGDLGHFNTNRSSNLGLATVPRDRFAGARVTDGTTAFVKSKPLRCSGRFLALTFDATGPDACVSVLHAHSPSHGTLLKNLTFCDLSATDYHVGDDFDLARFRHTADDLELAFQLAGNATLYTWTFFDKPNVTDAGHSPTPSPTQFGEASSMLPTPSPVSLPTGVPTASPVASSSSDQLNHTDSTDDNSTTRHFLLRH